jgi:hypothetical protein
VPSRPQLDAIVNAIRRRIECAIPWYRKEFEQKRTRRSERVNRLSEEARSYADQVAARYQRADRTVHRR